MASPERLAVRISVLEAHLLELTAPIQFIVAGVSLFSQVFHVHADQHLSKFHKIAMVFILNCRRWGVGVGGELSAITSLKMLGNVSKRFVTITPEISVPFTQRSALLA